MTRSDHQHVWGSKTRQPRPGDLCLACPAEWTARANGYHAAGYKPRTVPHVAMVKAAEEVA